ncbi:MAG: hypothetical protein ILP18_04000 [Treponema sp.]|nr:hypothetical protein [Treponema sp.]
MKAKYFFAVLVAALSVSFAAAENVTLIDCTGAKVTVDLPSEVVKIINDNYATVQNELVANNVSAETIRDVSSRVNTAYGKLSDYGLKSLAPITDAQDALNELCGSVVDVVPDSQMQQNVWAKAWMGKGFHIGGGVNAGISFMNINSLLDAANSLGMDTKGIPGSIPFPTATADIRVAMPFFPIDIGATMSLFDTRKISGSSDIFDKFALDFFNFGFDVRYPIIKRGPLNSVLSLGGGYYYSKGGFSITDDDASASLKYKSSTFKIDAQYSLKLAVLVPFVGARLAFTQSSSDWEIDMDWKDIYSGESSYIAMAQDWGVLPTKFSGGAKSSFTEGIRPQLYGGIGLDILCFDLTASACFDITSRIPSVAFSARISF